MSSRAFIFRYLLIINRLRTKPHTSYEELKSYFDYEYDIQDFKDEDVVLGFSKRTFQRDIKAIKNIYNIDIEYSRSGKGYYITDNELTNTFHNRKMEYFDIYNYLQLSNNLTPYILLEKRRPQRTENIHGLIHAIKNRLQISFSYQKFEDDESSLRLVEPYALKEFKNRWYLMAKDIKDNLIKSFALDRLSNLEIGVKFNSPDYYDIEGMYQHCFGIISPNAEKPQNIILSFNQFQGKFIKTLPLHYSQKILTDNDNELIIELKLFVTHDLIMELLSFGNNVKVIKPPSLIKQIMSEHLNAYQQYNYQK